MPLLDVVEEVFAAVALIGGGGKARKCPEWRSDFFPWRPVVPSGGANLIRFVLGTEYELEKKEKEKCAPAEPSTGLLSSFFLFVFFSAEQIASLISHPQAA